MNNFGLSASDAPLLGVSTGLVTCFGGSDGTAATVVSGGTDPYTYDWSNGATGPIQNNLPAGNYVITVTDDADCEAVATFTIGQNPELVYTVDAVSAVAPDCNGEAAVNVTGGVFPYDYLWDDPNTTQLSFAQDLCAGDYNVTVTDAEGCEVVATVTVPTVPGFGELWQRSGMQVYPNPASDLVQVVIDRNGADAVQLRVYNSIGAQVLAMPLPQDGRLSLGDLAAGVYWITATDGRERWMVPVVVE